MRNLTLLALFASIAPAAAQPVTRPSRCEVTIARAPDDVRAVIEAWIAAEPRCETTLDLRVIPTDGGLYLLARDERGLVRERVVPDAESAGVLVASWIADDAVGPPPDLPEPAIEVHVEIRPPACAPCDDRLPRASATDDQVPTHRDDARRGRWLTLGAMAEVHNGRGDGQRVELDLARWGTWSLGAVAASSSGNLAYAMQPGYSVETEDLRALATLTRTASFGRWELALAIGAGVTRTHVFGTVVVDGIDPQPLDEHGVFPIGEASAAISRRLGRGWAIAAGPIATWFPLRYRIEGTYGTAAVASREGQLMMFGGVRRRL